ncbi:flagellar biosynthesis protein FliQ [Desnuesiella massiliensis]|uniref:flagellar biosynthesis protein FliQ n=1 Tax=Desnuesiella massiliensis TaxID=1650662 RepID=UPI0006E3410C|nr:flagellar biosynthesis protein FliQ [Desnuesiella massiliensis]
MSETMIMGIIKDALSTAMLVAAPILLVSIIVGLLISIFQATTQIQEQTLTFVPKLIAIAVVGLIAGSWMLNTIIRFTERIFDVIANIVQ